MSKRDSPCSRLDGTRFRHASRREGSEGSEGGASTSSWFRFRDRSEQSDGSNENSRGWGGFRRRQRDTSRGSTDTRPPSAEGHGGPNGPGGQEGGVARGSLRFNVPRKSTTFSPEREGLLLSPTATAPMTSSSSDPPKRNAGSGRGIDSVIYSPASSARGTPSSDMFFGSGNTTPSLVTSPPPLQSGLSSPSFSPPISPPPLAQLYQPSAIGRGPVARDYAQRHSVADPLVLQPVPSPKKTSTVTSPALPEVKVTTSTSGAPKPHITSFYDSTVVKKVADASRSSALRPSKTESNIQSARLLSDIESESTTPRATPSREQKKYVRRRYTDTRHPTKELPDVRLEIPDDMSVKTPPVRKLAK